MIRMLINKEISGVLHSFRFQILIVLTMLVFLIAGLFHVNSYHIRHEGDNLDLNKQALEIQEHATSLNRLATLKQHMVRKAKAGDVISLNGEKGLPDLIFYNAFVLGESGYKSEHRSHLFANNDLSNYKLNQITQFDWAFIAGVILSFFILVLTYDAFSGEKQAGTLKLQCAFPVSRMSLFIAKYLAFLLIITSVFILGIILNLITIKLASGFQAEIPSPLQIGGIMITYMIYFSFFILLGLWFSSKAGEPATSLAYSLFTWLILVFFLPSAMAMLAEKIHPIPSSFEHNQQSSATSGQVFDNAPPKAQSYGPPSSFGGKVYPHMELRKKAIDEMTTVMNEFNIKGFNDMYSQVKLGADLGKISPFVIIRSISERIAGNGLEDFYQDFNRVVIHRSMLLEFIEERDREDPESFHFVNSWHPETYSSAPVEADEIPIIEDADPKLGSALKDSVLDVGILIFFNLLVLVGAWSGFLRYDVR